MFEFKDMLLKISQITKVSENDILDVFWYGSYIYGTNNSQSDFDFMVVINDKLSDLNDREFKSYDGIINIHLQTKETFQTHLNDMKFKELELYFLPKEYILKSTTKFTFKLDLSKLRCEISSKSNNSWAKAHKKLDISYEDDYIGLKSLYHSFRIYAFGIQIAKYKTINNFKEFNNVYFEIFDLYNKGFKTWDEFKSLFQVRYNNIASEFKKLAPK